MRRCLKTQGVGPDCVRDHDSIGVRLGQDIIAEGSADGPERVAQVLARRVGKAVGPEQISQLITSLGPTTGHDQVSQQAYRFRGTNFNEVVIAVKLGRTKKKKSQHVHAFDYSGMSKLSQQVAEQSQVKKDSRKDRNRDMRRDDGLLC
jgi:hypothetical protein